MKHIPTLLLALILPSACALFPAPLNAPPGIQNVTPASGTWQVTVQAHPEASGVYQFDFGSLNGAPFIKVNTPAGKVGQAPLSWASGNFDIYITYPSTSGYDVSERLAMAILSTTKMAGVYSYTNGGGAATTTVGGLGTTGGSVYQASCTADFVAPSTPSAAPSQAPAN